MNARTGSSSLVEELKLEAAEAQPYVLTLETCREMAAEIRSGRYEGYAREYLIDSLTGDALEACMNKAPDADLIGQMVLDLRIEFLPNLQA